MKKVQTRLKELGFFDGPISGFIQNLAGGSVGALVNGLGSVGVPQDVANTVGAFALMPGWVVAALFHNIGS